MQLPFATEASVGQDKLVNYLLSMQHPHGRSKATFFQRLGFPLQEPGALRDALLDLAVTTDMTEIEFEYGLKYIGTGNIVSPTGRKADVTTVWILRNGEPPPWLVTAFPG
jgi:hypothetical protein